MLIKSNNHEYQEGGSTNRFFVFPVVIVWDGLRQQSDCVHRLETGSGRDPNCGATKLPEQTSHRQLEVVHPAERKVRCAFRDHLKVGKMVRKL